MQDPVSSLRLFVLLLPHYDAAPKLLHIDLNSFANGYNIKKQMRGIRVLERREEILSWVERVNRKGVAQLDDLYVLVTWFSH
jgi:hypothetical protein